MSDEQKKSYSSILTSRKYKKKYSKRVDSFLSIKCMHLLISPNDVRSVRTIAYEKQSDDKLVTADVIIYVILLNIGIRLYCTHQFIKKDIECEYPDFFKMSAELNDIEDELIEFGMIKQ